ncbi:hypothetical protein [Rufibacter sp. LB8]|uniref:hypothetical protein n=1 Tax=Rufibacter sp. LB8 TaxID=2777781 RepID=UPI00178C1DAF|nr:hypothetical protein [Rufibacter sp. LB8]
MKIRFRSIELVVLLGAFLVIGFTAGYLYANGFSFAYTQLITEQMILIAAFGMVIPFIFGLYMISRGIYGIKVVPEPPHSKRHAKKKMLEKI